MATDMQHKEDGIDSWIYPLRNFIDEATRYKIDGVYNTVQPDSKFSTLFEDYVRNGRHNFEQFRKELREKLSQSVNFDIILKDVKGEFEPMIRQYKQWYEDNKVNTVIFEPYNPYRLMFELVLSTEQEINKYSPKHKPGRKQKQSSYKTLFKDPVIGEKVKEIFEKENIIINGRYVKDPERSNNNSELLAAFYVLRPLFDNHNKTPASKCFFDEFGCPHLSDRMMSDSDYTNNKDRERFKKLFLPLLNHS